MSQKLKKKILKSSFLAGACHIGSALSCIDIIERIHKIKKPQDVFIFGKASGVSAYYCYKYPLKKATELLKKHPLASREAGCIWSGGSIGQATSVGAGMALGDRERDAYVLLGDGDMQEGQTYEALLFARQHKLRNLKIYVDRNHLQALGNTEKILGIKQSLKSLQDIFPLKVVETIKGSGVKFMSNKYEWHYKNLTKEGYEEAIRQLVNKKGKKGQKDLASYW
jgi:transketolase